MRGSIRTFPHPGEERTDPIAGARVTVESGPSAVSAEDGSFVLPRVPEGEIWIAVEHPDFEPERQLLDLAVGSSHRILLIEPFDCPEGEACLTMADAAVLLTVGRSEATAPPSTCAVRLRDRQGAVASAELRCPPPEGHELLLELAGTPYAVVFTSQAPSGSSPTIWSVTVSTAADRAEPIVTGPLETIDSFRASVGCATFCGPTAQSVAVVDVARSGWGNPLHLCPLDPCN